jgi:hypothetical protein
MYIGCLMFDGALSIHVWRFPEVALKLSLSFNIDAGGSRYQCALTILSNLSLQC